MPLSATVEMAQASENGTSISVSFQAINGSTTVDLGSVAASGNVTTAGPTVIVGAWDSTNTSTPADPDLVYDIVATVTNGTADDNATNDTMTLTAAVDWKAPDMGVSAISAPATGLIGDDVTVVVELTNVGDADFGGNVSVSLFADAQAAGSGYHNASTTAVAPAGTADVSIVVDTSGFSAGDVKFTATTSPAGSDDADANATTAFAVKASNVYVDAIAFSPSAGVKHTQTVTITATLKNNGTDDFNGTVTFKQGTTEIGTVTEFEVLMASTGDDASFDWTTGASDVSVDYLIWVEVDGNMANASLTVGPQPHTDLSVVGIALSPTTLTAKDKVGDEQEVTVTVTVANAGDLDAVDAVVALTANGGDAGSTTANVTAGGQADVVFTYMAKTLEDDSEVNLTATIGIASDFKLLAVPGDIDLAEFEIAVSAPVKQERGLSIDITATVTNVGDATAAEVTVTFMAGTTEIGTAMLYNVSDVNTTDAFTWNIPSSFALGATTINATIGDVDAGMNFTVEEYRKPVVTIEFEKNKKGKVMKYTGEAADGAKKTVKVKVILTNTGEAAAKNVNITIKDAKGNELGSALVASIAADGTHEETIAIKLKAGSSGKMTASAAYDGIHDDEYPAVSSTESAGWDIAVIPGFEAIVFVAAIGIAIVVLSRRRK